MDMTARDEDPLNWNGIMPLDKDKWFTEACPEAGSAFSLELAAEGLLHSEKTDFQQIDIYATSEFGHLMVIDGFTMLSQRDNFIYHEMLVHPALFSHHEPSRVAIIGGGDCGTLLEVLKHREVKQATQVEIDQRVTDLAREYFPELCAGNQDPRAKLLFQDGIEWIRQAPNDSLDVIIVDSTDPIGPAVGLFGEAFYRDCRRALGPAGLLVQQSESPMFHLHSILQPMRQAMSAAGFGQVNTLHFPLIVYPGGWWTATMAGDIPLRYRREQDARAARFSTSYYNPDIHQACQAEPEFMKRVLAGQA
jgi:spermidine synthase